MRRLDGGSIEETLNIGFRSTRDDNFEPRSVSSRVGQIPQEDRTTLRVATFVECINDKDESVFRVARKGADEFKEEMILHRLWCQVWVIAKTVCYNLSKSREYSREFVDESWKDIFGLAQVRVIPPTEEGSSKVLSIMEVFTNRMSQRCFPHSRGAVEPIRIRI